MTTRLGVLSALVLSLMAALIVLPPISTARHRTSPVVSPTTRTLSYTPPCRSGDVYRNNGRIAAAMSLGVLTGGLLSAALVLGVGLSTGLMLGNLAAKLPLWFLVVSYVPHALLEIPGIALAGGAGLSSLLLLGARRPPISLFARAWLTAVVLSQVLLMSSAVVECHVTPWGIRLLAQLTIG